MNCCHPKVPLKDGSERWSKENLLSAINSPLSHQLCRVGEVLCES